MTDGIMYFLGIIVGVALTTLDSKLVLIAGIVGGVADPLSNFGFFLKRQRELFRSRMLEMGKMDTFILKEKSRLEESYSWPP